MYLASAIVASLLPAGDFVPELIDVRMQEISRAASEQDWPFAANSGTLACVRSLGIKVVIFMPDPKLANDEDAALDDFVDNKYVQVTTNPFELFADFGKAALFTPDLKIEDKIKRLGPFVTLGRKLCDQPKGTILGPSEL
jgi:hypothetical protein